MADFKVKLLCEWITDEGEICGLEFPELPPLLTHIRFHLCTHLQLGTCPWYLCDHTSTQSSDHVKHVLFHGYHAFLKQNGYEILTKQSLPPCYLGQEFANIIPSDIRETRCYWGCGENGDSTCGQEFDCTFHFYEHVQKHVGDGRDCGWRGV